MDIEQDIDLRQIFEVVRRRLWVLVVMVVTATLVSGILSFYFIPPTYTASVTLMVAKRESPVADYSTLLMNQNLVRTYAEIAKSRTVARRVVDSLGLHTTVTDLQDRINVTAVRDTQVIRIAVEGGTPQGAQATANAVASAFMEQVQSLMKVENVAVVDPAEAPTAASKPRPLLNVALAAMLGSLVGFGLMFLLEYLDNTIKNSDDVTRYLGLPLLGTIPLIDLRLEERQFFHPEAPDPRGTPLGPWEVAAAGVAAAAGAGGREWLPLLVTADAMAPSGLAGAGGTTTAITVTSAPTTAVSPAVDATSASPSVASTVTDVTTPPTLATAIPATTNGAVSDPKPIKPAQRPSDSESIFWQS